MPFRLPLTYHYLAFVFLENILKNLPTAKTIETLLLIETFLPSDFPKIVRPAINELIKAAIITSSAEDGELLKIFKTIDVPAAPLNIPHTSPSTSAHSEATLSALFNNINDSFAPLTFLDAIALNGSFGQAVTATPIISVKTDIDIKIKIITVDNIIPDAESKNSLEILKNNESENAKKNIFIGHNHFDSLFDFLTLFFISSLFKKKKAAIQINLVA